LLRMKSTGDSCAIDEEVKTATNIKVMYILMFFILASSYH
jgi:hypothetical protein